MACHGLLPTDFNHPLISIHRQISDQLYSGAFFSPRSMTLFCLVCSLSNDEDCSHGWFPFNQRQISNRLYSGTFFFSPRSITLFCLVFVPFPVMKNVVMGGFPLTLITPLYSQAKPFLFSISAVASGTCEYDLTSVLVY